MLSSPVFEKTAITAALTGLSLLGMSPQLQAKDSFAIGAGARYQSSLYSGVENDQSVLPDFDVQYGRFFFKGKELGWSSNDLTLGLSTDLLSGKRDDSKTLPQLKDVNTGINLKLGWKYKLTTQQTIKLAVLQDVGDEHRGQQANLSWSYLQMTGRWVIVPELSALWMSQEVKQHYFSSADEHIMGAGHAYSAALKLAYPLSRQWLFNSKLSQTQFEENISRSAIVEHSNRHSIYLGLRYYW